MYTKIISTIVNTLKKSGKLFSIQGRSDKRESPTFTKPFPITLKWINAQLCFTGQNFLT